MCIRLDAISQRDGRTDCHVNVAYNAHEHRLMRRCLALQRAGYKYNYNSTAVRPLCDEKLAYSFLPRAIRWRPVSVCPSVGLSDTIVHYNNINNDNNVTITSKAP